jgi:hypothetical protein
LRRIEDVLRIATVARLGVVTAATVLLGITLSAQKGVPRTPDGRPDFQGLWLNGTATPLERPAAFAGKPFATDAEAEVWIKRYQLDRTAAASHVDPAFELEVAGDLDTYEPGRLLPGNRTSLITDPADGRVPALTPAAQKRLTERNEHVRDYYAQNPEDFTLAERCIQVANTSAPPMMPAYYNNTVHIVQTRDFVMIESEMIHDVRVIPLDGRPHPPPVIQLWKGHSVGRWEGDTLVIDTTNFTDKTTLRGSGTSLHVVERLTLADTNTLTYRFTIDDPEAFVRPWSGESAMGRTNDRMYEYACHEGNQSLPLLMRGARFSEKHEGRTTPR